MNKDKSNKTPKGLTEGQITSIKQLKADGFASRYIAALIGVSKTTVNNFLNGRSGSKVKSKEQELPTLKEGARVLLYDVETSPALSYTFGRHKQFISQDGVYKEGGWIICASYRWLGEKDNYVIYSKSDIANAEDIGVVTKLWELYNEADAVIAHNALQFDHKMLQGRVMINGLPPLPSVKVVDTLVMAKKNFRLPNNKLDSLSEILGIGRKVQHSGIKLWVDVLAGNEEALETMLDYCQHDTDLLHEVYMRLRSFGTASNFNASHYYKDNKERCNICGSTDIELTGRVTHTDVSTFAEVRCNSCGGIHRKREVLNTKEKRKSLMANIKV
jgi:hypothetical protein